MRVQRPVLVAIGAAVVVAVALVSASLVSARGDSPAPASSSAMAPVGAAEVSRLLGGIPQDGVVLGRKDAPVTLVEYADLQCPYCAIWERNTLPALVREYVRSGKLRIEFRGLAFIGPDSETALRAALAAGQKNRLWHVVELLYLNQGHENSGWVTEGLLTGILRAAGLDATPVLGARESAAVDRELAKAAAQARAAKVGGTPSFELGRTGGGLAPLAPRSLAPAPFRTAIAQLLGS
jgi:protein-disulfide isomerase